MPHIKKLVLKGFKSFARETEIPLINGMNSIVGPNGSGKSARWDTEVLLASGDKKPIGEIVEDSLKKSRETKKIDDGVITKENPLGVRVLSINPKTMKIEESEVRAFMKREGEPNLYTIKTSTGKEVTTTSCHPVMIYKNGEIVSEIVENLKQGDFIATPNKIDLAENNLKISINEISQDKSNSEEFSRFIGYIIGDGCIIKNSRIDFVNADQEILEDYERTANFLGFKVSIAKRKGTIAINAYLYSRNFANNLIEFFNNNYKKEKKHIPKEILFGKKKLLANFLAALFDCDAYVSKRNTVFEYTTMSNELAENVILALLRFGIVARKTKKMKYASNTQAKRKKEYFFISVEGKEKISKLYKNIPLKCIHKKELLKKWAENPVQCNTNNDLLPLEINSEIKKVFQLCGIKIKPIRKEYPLLSAYIENRCNASRSGLKRIIPLIEKKLKVLTESYRNISLNQRNLIECMRQLNFSGQETSRQIGLDKCVIMSSWASGKFNARQKNLEKFYQFIKNSLEERIMKAGEILFLLKNIAGSGVFWDKIKKIEKVKGEEFVYDIDVEGNHNFIANNIFVHNSNITDSICFVLGRLSSKSMRAAKTSNLIFAGTHDIKPASEASVKLVFDNLDKSFPIESKEAIIERIARRNGQSIYKINDETKTRQEVLELMSSAGIDPYGFNIILQGEITSIVKMHSEERRKVIEEVAGISVYETRKEKSIHELEKTDEKLKEVSAILRERRSYLKNLEEERKQALKFKQIEDSIKRFKASLLSRKIEEKKKETSRVSEEIEKREKAKEKQKSEIESINSLIIQFEQEINSINQYMQQQGGIEQESLREEISNLRAEIAGLSVKKENNEARLKEILERRKRAEDEIKTTEAEVKDLRKHSPLQAQKSKELDEKKKFLAEIEKDKKMLYNYKEKLNSMKLLIAEKEKRLQKVKNESDFIIKESSRISEELSYKDIEVCKKALEELKQEYQKILSGIEFSEHEKLESEKKLSVFNSEISALEEIKSKVEKIDTCPLCRSKITPEHVNHVSKECDEKILSLSKKIKESEELLEKSKSSFSELKNKRDSLPKEISKAEISLIKLKNIEEKKEHIKSLLTDAKSIEAEIKTLSLEKQNFENKVSNVKDVEDKYDKILIEIQEISSRTEDNLDINLEFKERDLEKTKLIIKQSFRDEDSLSGEIKEISSFLEEKESALEKKDADLNSLEEKFKKSIQKKDSLQSNIREKNTHLQEKRADFSSIESLINNLKIDRARVGAELENLEIDFQPYKEVSIIQATISVLQEKLQKAESEISSIGSVNLRALEVYDSVKNEYDSIEQKSLTLESEKIEILKIIEEIDKKKKRTFTKTLGSINELFNRNFMQLSTKGEVFLELENPEDPFSGGLNVTVRVAKGKYFDVTGLSGGEQTLVALSLLFSIQEYKPYCFYIFDEVDAALDKRNSEKLASLIKKYMKTGQYIIVTHNDSLITASPVLYGISMQEGISKLISLEI